MILDGPFATFTDPSLENNLFCYNISEHKVCSPRRISLFNIAHVKIYIDLEPVCLNLVSAMRVSVRSFDIKPPFNFVRGYFDTMFFSLTIANDDVMYDVVETEYPDTNFNISIVTAVNNLGKKPFLF